MLNNIPQNSWSQVKSEIQRTWNGLDADRLEGTNGDVSQISQLVSDRTGLSRADAQKTLSEIVDRCESQGRSQSAADMSSIGGTQSSVGRPSTDRASRGEESQLDIGSLSEKSLESQGVRPGAGAQQQASQNPSTQMPEESNRTGFQTNSNPSTGSMGRH